MDDYSHYGFTYREIKLKIINAPVNRRLSLLYEYIKIGKLSKNMFIKLMKEEFKVYE